MLFCFLATTVLVYTVSFSTAFVKNDDLGDGAFVCRRSCETKEGRDSEKVISLEECVKSCVQERSLGNQYPAYGHEKSKGSQSRIQRSVSKDKGVEVDKKCKNSQDQTIHHAIVVEGLNVDFTAKKPHVYISWNRMDLTNTAVNWTAYHLIYTSSKKDFETPFCRIMPKNQTDCIVSGEHWKSPEVFYVQVVLFPYNKNSMIGFVDFDPHGIGPPPISPELPTKDSTKVVVSIVAGLVVGIVLLVCMSIAYLWRRSKLCPSQYPAGLLPPPPSPNCKDVYYSCYYPENDAFREKVASVVNYFRQNGYDVIMDVMVSKEISSQGPTRWAERQIRKARKVLIFLSPGLVNLAFDEQEGGHSQDINRVWVELEVLRDLYTRSRSAAKMVCIGLPDSHVSSQDLPLWAKTSYKWPEDAQEVLKRLNDRPSILPV